MDHRLALVRPTLRMGPRALARRAHALQLAWRRELRLLRRWVKRECRQATRSRRAWLPCLSANPGGQEEEEEKEEGSRQRRGEEELWTTTSITALASKWTHATGT